MTSRRRARHSSSERRIQAPRFGKRFVDLAYRHPARRANGKPGEVDLHADRAPPCPHQPIVDAGAGQHDSPRLRLRRRARRPVRPPKISLSAAGAVIRRATGTPSRATSPSIHVSTSLMSVVTSFPAGEIGLAERNRHCPGTLSEQSLRPQVAGIVRDGQYRRRELDGEPRAAGLVFRPGAGSDSRAFRIDDDPEALTEPFAALRRDLLHRVGARLAVDRDGRSQREAPAEERNRQELLLGDVGKRREEQGEGERFPRGAVLRHHDVRRRRNVLGADDAVPYPAYPARAPQIRAAPRRRDAVHRHARNPEQSAASPRHRPA